MLSAANLSMVSTAITGVGFFLATSLVSVLLTTGNQSKYFMVMSLLALQSAFDLGATPILMTNIAYRRRNRQVIQGLSDDVKAVVRLSLRYSVVCTISYIIFLSFVYLVPFKINSISMLEAFALSVSSGASMLATFICAFFEGLGFIRKSYVIRFLMNVSRTAVLLLALLGGSGTYAITISVFVSAIIGWIGLVLVGDLPQLWRVGFGHDNAREPGHINWFNCIFPSQWRSSISWLSAYIIYQGPIWLAFSKLDSKESSRFSLSWNIFMGLSTLGSGILSTSAASISTLIGSGSVVCAVEVWKRKSIILVMFSATTGVFFILALLAAPQKWLLSDRFLGLLEMFFLLIFSIANQVIYCAVIIGRSGGREPYYLHYLIWVIMLIASYGLSINVITNPFLIVLLCTVSSLIMVPLFLKTGKNAIPI